MAENNPDPGSFKVARDGATFDAISALEIVQDEFPDVARSERAYLQTVNRLADFLRERYLEIATDTLREHGGE